MATAVIGADAAAVGVAGTKAFPGEVATGSVFETVPRF